MKEQSQSTHNWRKRGCPSKHSAQIYGSIWACRTKSAEGPWVICCWNPQSTCSDPDAWPKRCWHFFQTALEVPANSDATECLGAWLSTGVFSKQSDRLSPVLSLTNITEDRTYLPQCPHPQGLDAFLEAVRFLSTSALGSVSNTSQLCIIGFRKIPYKVNFVFKDLDRPALVKIP